MRNVVVLFGPQIDGDLYEGSIMAGCATDLTFTGLVAGTPCHIFNIGDGNTGLATGIILDDDDFSQSNLWGKTVVVCSFAYSAS